MNPLGGMPDPAIFGKVMGTAIKEAVEPLRQRIKELETSKAIDAVALDELANCLERIDALEDGDNGKRNKSLDEERDGAEAPACRGIASALIDRDGDLVLTMTDGSAQKVGRVVGRDGLSLESRELRYVAETHEIVESWTVAGAKREFRYPAGGICDRGYWSEGMEVLAGQAVTHNGSLWIAKCTTRAKPCHENSTEWRIGARKGRDAKDSK